MGLILRFSVFSLFPPLLLHDNIPDLRLPLAPLAFYIVQLFNVQFLFIEYWYKPLLSCSIFFFTADEHKVPDGIAHD